MRVPLLCLLLGLTSVAIGQKRPLDPSVYDGWESIGERILSPDGKYLVYTITPQEGDARLFIRSTENTYAKEIPRGANASITSDGRFLVFHIRPFFKDSREARIKKKTPDQSPKDTLAWLELGTGHLTKIPRVRSYKLSEKEGDWLAWLREKAEPVPPTSPDSLTRIHRIQAQADSLTRVVDSLCAKITEIGVKGFTNSQKTPAPRTARPGETIEEGTELVLHNLLTGEERKFPLVSEYYLSKKGNTLILETTRKNGDSIRKALVLWVNTANGKTDTVIKGFQDARNYALDEQGAQLAFIAERDSTAKALVKFYRLWYYKPGADSAILLADRSAITAALASSGSYHFPSIPMQVTTPASGPNIGAHPPAQREGGLTISPDYANAFSKDGARLFLGLAPIRPPKDTSLVEFETSRLDIWNYQDDYLAPQQLVQLNNELKRSYLAMIGMEDHHLIPLADGNCESITLPRQGEGAYALGESTKGYRIQQQWEESNYQHIYLVDLHNGSRRLVAEKVRGRATLSPGGKFILWYDWKGKNWFTYDIATGKTTNITAGIKVPLFDEEDDHPDDPPPHGTMGWTDNDRFIYIYDKYDIWQCDPTAQKTPINLTGGIGRRRQYTFRQVNLDREDPVIHDNAWTLLTVFNQKDMTGGWRLYKTGTPFILDTSSAPTQPLSYNNFFRAKNNWTLGWLQGSYAQSYDVHVMSLDTSTANRPPASLSTTTTTPYPSSATVTMGAPYSHTNPQQKNYNWFTVELHHWKMFDGKMSEGLLYKPENFDSTKKYPIIFYFYERDAQTRYNYITPQPVRASINIAYFTSNGYLVFDPDIFYKTGQPGEDAYNSVMSAVKYLSRFKWVDTTKMALQGHSWGGYQVAYLVTRTHVFAAAEAGAPVANMTSAYGGIRWETGISRQFQYEKSQSRIGSTLWQHPELYIKNSPLFRADKVTTPLLMMHNDADGAVPWYQGIEYFSALRRLGKKAWLLEYNGENHGLGERRNRKDWSLRLSQFFGYYLKGEPPARWITEGVPATLKGIDWGLGTE